MFNLSLQGGSIGPENIADIVFALNPILEFALGFGSQVLVKRVFIFFPILIKLLLGNLDEL